MLDGDPGLFADALKYSERDVSVELRLVSAIRQSTGRILQACEIEKFQRTGVHSAEGPMTLEALVERAVRHIPHHLGFIREKLNALSDAAN